jgi:hypothetical protein
MFAKYLVRMKYRYIAENGVRMLMALFQIPE